MHMPSSIQLVALSATLKDPESFLRWIERARGRKGSLVRRLDRHVPLHVGGLDPGRGFFGVLRTHDSADHKAGVLTASSSTSSSRSRC